MLTFIPQETTPMTTPEMQDRDEAFRRKQAASTDPKAQEWTALDKQAQAQQVRIEQGQRKLEGREDGSRLERADGHLSQLRDQRDAMLREGAPNRFRKDARDAWFKSYEALEGKIQDAHAAWKHELKASTPEALTQQRERIAERQIERDRAEDQRRGIEKLPSEKEQDSQTRVQAMLGKLRERAEKATQAWAPPVEPQSLQSWREGRQPQQAAVGRMGYAQYAATAKKEADYMRKYEEEWKQAQAQSR